MLRNLDFFVTLQELSARENLCLRIKSNVERRFALVATVMFALYSLVRVAVPLASLF